MRKSAWIVAAAAMTLLVATGGATPGFAGDEAAPAVPAAANVVKHQAICPVMGGEVNKNLFVDYEGKRLYVCCKGCIETVKKDPAKWFKQVEAEGITLDKVPKAPAKDHDRSTMK